MEGCVIALPGGGQIKCDKKLANGQFIICKGKEAYVADGNRKRIADLSLDHAAELPAGEAKFSVRFLAENGAPKVHFDFTVWALGKGDNVGKRGL
jgi:hypothetical protein